eukprot:744746_1
MRNKKKRHNPVGISSDEPSKKKRRRLNKESKQAIFNSLASGEYELRDIKGTNHAKPETLKAYQLFDDVYSTQTQKRVVSKCKYCDTLITNRHGPQMQKHFDDNMPKTLMVLATKHQNQRNQLLSVCVMVEVEPLVTTYGKPKKLS